MGGAGYRLAAAPPRMNVRRSKKPSERLTRTVQLQGQRGGDGPRSPTPRDRVRFNAHGRAVNGGRGERAILRAAPGSVGGGQGVALLAFMPVHRQWLLAIVCLAALLAVFFVPRIPQDPHYHAFVDGRTLLGVPNFWNVISNIGYLVVGIYGLARVNRVQSPVLRPAYITFCVAVALVAFGSSWYHYAPTTDSLFWDRLPMAAGFMALLSIVLGERVSWRLSTRLLWPLVIIGIATTLYWAWTEKQSVGDLRPYGLVQYLSVLLLPLLLLLFPGNRRSTMWLWWTFAGYAVAKIAEQLDGPIYNAIGLSGHSIKHFVSSVAVLFAVFAMQEMKAPRTAKA
jgi:ceramidase